MCVCMCVLFWGLVVFFFEIVLRRSLNLVIREDLTNSKQEYLQNHLHFTLYSLFVVGIQTPVHLQTHPRKRR